MIPPEFLLIYLGLINLLTLILFGFDKGRAKKSLQRVPEATLFLISLAGGAFGGVAGMILFRHKTKKWSFKAAMLVIFLINLFYFYLLFKYIL